MPSIDPASVPTSVPFDNSLDKDAVMEWLKAKYPQGLRMDKGGEIVGLEDVHVVKDLTAFADELDLPQELVFELRGKKYKVRVKQLTGDDVLASDSIPEPVPPKKPKLDLVTKKVVGEEIDWEDPDYLKKQTEAFHLKRALMISRGLVDIQVPGENVAAKAEYLRKKFPPQVLELLRMKIKALTSDVVEKAAFI